MSGKDNTTEGTTPNTHQVSEPHITYSRTWHTVGGTLQEVSSSEATNTFEPTFWPSNPYDRKPKQVYVYETVEETSWDEGKTPNSEGTPTGNYWHHDTQLSNNRDREYVYGTITTHHITTTTGVYCSCVRYHHNNHGCVLFRCTVDLVGIRQEI
ncbi:hypothetical protein Pmani_013185 [Petrolisthes manimaculis]|uniref:Uncharacterized protein n=2 Tax=Petrolisthes manimaculis TaxID=1843537 RepID=A0AAE1PX09_9EUCA|nr:hypothetical protein Pmani_013185 [Petrolisthes manimaculis]